MEFTSEIDYFEIPRPENWVSAPTDIALFEIFFLGWKFHFQNLKEISNDAFLFWLKDDLWGQGLMKVEHVPFSKKSPWYSDCALASAAEVQTLAKSRDEHKEWL